MRSNYRVYVLLMVLMMLVSIMGGAQMDGNSGVWKPRGDLYTVGEGVTAPVIIHRESPVLPTEAKARGYGGTVVIYCIIDKAGRPEHIKVVVPLGLGLDESAIEAVSKWRFKPASKNGETQIATASLEIRF